MAGRIENRSVGVLLTLIVLFCSCACEDHPAINGKLSHNFYAKTSCPNVEKIVRKAVQLKIQQTFVTIPGTLRLFFHDCIINGCDASLMIQSTPENKAEKDHPDNLSLAGDGFDTINKAKQAIEAIPACRNLVSCADILAIATRDVVNLAGGPFWPVELGRRDSLVSRASDVNGRLPAPTFDLNQLITLFARKGLSMTDIIALSAAHTVGFSHCDRFANRVYSFPSKNRVDPTLNPQYASALKEMCPVNVDPRIAINMDPTTPRTFDNVYYKNLVHRLGLFTSDQVLFEDRRSKPFVQLWAQNSTSFKQAFAQAMIKLGRVGVLTGDQGNIRTRCDVFN